MKKTLSLLLSLLMLFSAFPVIASAESPGEYGIGGYESLQILVAGYSVDFERGDDEYIVSHWDLNSYKAYKSAYDEANEVLKNEKSTEADFDAAYDKLYNAHEALIVLTMAPTQNTNFTETATDPAENQAPTVIATELRESEPPTSESTYPTEPNTNQIINPVDPGDDAALRAVQERFPSITKLDSLGKIGLYAELFYEPGGTKAFVDWENEFIVGEYRFYESCGHTGQNDTSDLGLFIVRDNNAYTISEYYDKYYTDMDYIYSLIKGYDGMLSFRVEKLETATDNTEPEANIPVPSTAPQAETVEAPTEAPTSNVIYTLKEYISKKENKSYELIRLDRCDELTRGLYLVHYRLHGFMYSEYYAYMSIGKYLYKSGPPFCEIYDYEGGRLYSIEKAYENGVIGSKELKLISKYLGDSFKLNKVKTTPGDIDAGALVYSLAGNKPKSSDKSVLRIGKKGELIGLRKGTATVTALSNSGKKHSLSVTVTRDPRLMRYNKVVKTVNVRKGKSLKVRVDGLVTSMKMSFKNTKTAKITREKEVDYIAVRGLRCGKTTLKVRLNGSVELKLKVKVFSLKE